MALWRRPPAHWMALGLLAGGLATFAVTTSAGLDVNRRYVLLAATALCILAAYLVAGALGERAGSRLRVPWLAGGVAAALLALTVGQERVRGEVAERRTGVQQQLDLRAEVLGALENPAVRAGLRCGPVNVPTYYLAPEARWELDLDADSVAIAPHRREGAGVYVYYHDPAQVRALAAAIPERAFDAAANIPPAGSQPAGRSGALAVAVLCPAP